MYTFHRAAAITAALFALAQPDQTTAQCQNGTCFPSLTSPAAATGPRTPPDTKLLPAVVRVGHIAADATDWGSGTIIHRAGGRSYVLTCFHIFRDAWGRGRPLIRLHDRREFYARIVATDQPNDLALLEIVDPAIEPLTLADAPPAPRSRLTTGGYGSGTYRTTAATAIGFTSTTDARDEQTLVAAATNRPGDSGGPILDTHLRIVAVAWGCRDGRVYATCGTPLRRLLRAIMPPYGRIVVAQQPTIPPPTPRLAPLPPEPTPATRPTVDVAGLQGDLDALRTAIAQPITVQILDAAGNVAQTTEARLGGTLRLRIVPVPQK